MKKSWRKIIRFFPGDFIAVAVVLLLSFFVWLLFFLNVNDSGNYITVTENSDTLLAEYSLNKNGEYHVTSQNGYTLKVKIENGEAMVVSSDCPNGYCVQSGSISHAGEVIVCAPAHIKIRVDSVEEGGDYDAVIG